MDKLTEYSELRAELRQWDTTCVTVLGFLGGLWTAVYGFSDLEENSFVLIVLSILWIIGILYIVDKRFQIRKISLFLKIEVEDRDSGLYWETWQKENDVDTARRISLLEPSDENIKFVRFSPVEMEIYLALFVVISNTVYLYWNLGTEWDPAEIKQGWDVLFCILSSVIALGFALLCYRILSVYKRARD